MDGDERRRRLAEDGFCVVPGVLDAALLRELRAAEAELLAGVDARHRADHRYQGSNVALAFQHPALRRLYAWPPALAALADLGFPGAKWQSGYLISKPPGGPPLYWHQDWAAWDHPISARERPAQLFLMWYLVDTRRDNGCLRAIPGSHRRRIDLHARLTAAHEQGALGADPDDPGLFAEHGDAVDVPVRAGDLVIGDARVLHAAHANRSDAARTVMTLWWFPDFDELPEELRAAYGRRRAELPDDLAPALRGRIALYDGAARPTPFNRVPGRHLPA